MNLGGDDVGMIVFGLMFISQFALHVLTGYLEEKYS